jgi:hypothetical protein
MVSRIILPEWGYISKKEKTVAENEEFKHLKATFEAGVPQVII